MTIRILISILLNVFLLVWFVMYAIRYHLGEAFIAFVLNNKGSIDRVHRLQMRTKAERKELSGFLKTTSEFFKNIGFRSILPGNSPLWEAGIALYLAIDLVILSGIFKLVFVTRLLMGIAFLILWAIMGQNDCRKRTYDAEIQLCNLGRIVENAAIQYPTVSEIFSNHYMELDGALSRACEEYFISYLVNKDEKRSIQVFKDYFCSPMIDIMIENLAAGEEEDHDLALVGRLSAETAEDYVSATGGNRSLLMQARFRVCMMLISNLGLLLGGGIAAVVAGKSGKVDPSSLLLLFHYETTEVSFLPDFLQSGFAIYLLILNFALCLYGVYQKKGF